MFSAATVPGQSAAAGLDEAAEGLAWLHEMAGMGMQAARKVFAEIMAEPETPPAPDPDRFAALRELDRLSRWVRLTIALRSRLAAGLRARPASQSRGSNRYDRHDRLVRSSLDVRGAMGLAIEREAFTERERDEALAAVDRWLEHNPDTDFLTRPVSDILRRLCRDTGIPFEPALWAEEPWALEERADPPVTSAYRGWPPPEGGTVQGAACTRGAPRPAHPP